MKYCCCFVNIYFFLSLIFSYSPLAYTCVFCEMQKKLSGNKAQHPLDVVSVAQISFLFLYIKNNRKQFLVDKNTMNGKKNKSCHKALE